MSDQHDHSGHDHDHDHHDHDHGHDHPPKKPVPFEQDAGSQALAEALRSSFTILKFVMAGLVLVFLGSGFFTVGSQEKAMILRFGRPLGVGEKALLGAGPHWSWPYPIDEVVKIPITEIQKVTSTTGWFATTPEAELAGQEPPAGPSLNPAVDGYAITADGNIIHTRATLYYRIEDPIRYVFDFVNGSNAVQNVLNNALLYAAANTTVDDAVTKDIAGFKEKVRARVTELVLRENMGIVVEQCDVESRPPRQLKAAFDNAALATVVQGKVLNEAQSYANQVLTRASADSSSRTNLAETASIRLVKSVKAEAEQFASLLPKYNEDPALFVQRRQLEKISQVLTNVQEKNFLPELANGQKWEVRLQLSREPLKESAPKK